MVLFGMVAATSPPIEVDVDTRAIIRRFIPNQSLGAGYDGHDVGDNKKILTKENLAAMLSAGLQPLSYRLRTELAGEAWHWNPVGEWTDPKRKEGYWTSSDVVDKPIQLSYGYRLPRRGNTIDQANNDGYSRIDDGDSSTYWKSNPYLDPKFSSVRKTVPQWVVVDLGARRNVDEVEIDWANPYAQRFRFQYWEGNDALLTPYGPDHWVEFSKEPARCNQPGRQIIRLPLKRTQFVRVLLMSSSHTKEPSLTPDPRDEMGFAIRELKVGRFQDGRFRDSIVHRSNNTQTPIYVSSTDPWHRATDLDPSVEQLGFDAIFSSGLTRGLPMMAPTPALYDTPENVEAEVRWLLKRKKPISEIEIGEEPDGQYCSPEHYCELYKLFAKDIKQIAPNVPLGGPCFQSTLDDVQAWSEDGEVHGRWLARFIKGFSHKDLHDLFQFFSFEWYPFDAINLSVTKQLIREQGLLKQTMNRFKQDGLPATIPWVISEYGYSAYGAPQEDDLPGAIFDLELIGEFLSLGGSTAYLYGYEPDEPISEQDGLWGNLMLLENNPDSRTPWKLPAYWGANLLTRDWCGNPAQTHQLISTRLAGKRKSDLSAFSVLRPDGRVAMIVLNPNGKRGQTVRLKCDGRLVHSGTRLRYDPSRFTWLNLGDDSHPLKSLPPHQESIQKEAYLAPMSINVFTFDRPTH